MKRSAPLLLLALILSAHIAAKVTSHTKEVPGSYNFLFSAPDGSVAISPETIQRPDSLVGDSLSDTVRIPAADLRPLVVFLHGSSLCGKDLNRVRRYGTIDAIEKGRKIDAFVLAPQNPGGAWRPEKVMKLVDWAREHYPVDTNRIYVLGMSLGGYGTLDFAAAYPDKVAAAAAFCGGSTVKPDSLAGLDAVPLWIVHGTADRAISIKESDRVANAIKAVDSLATHLSYDRVKGMNHARPARFFYLPETYEWLFSHSLVDSGRALSPTPEVSDALLRTAYRGLKNTGTRRAKSSSKKSGSKSKTKK